MGGFYVSGSCQYPDDPEFYAFAAEPPECLPKIWDSGEAGSLHQFLSLVVTRGDPYLESDVVDDEYSVIYAKTVSMQLERDNITMDWWKWKVDKEYIQDTTVLVANWLYEAD